MKTTEPMKKEQSEELELAPSDAPNIETMKRIDAPALMKDFTAQLDPLERDSLAIVVTDASQIEVAHLADEKRKAIKAIRCAAENKRKELVAGMNKSLGEINTGFGEIWDRCTAAEKHLQEQVEFAANAERERIAKLQSERSAKLLALGANPALYDLGKMEQAGYDQLVEGLEIADQMRKERAAKEEATRLAAEKAADEERIAKDKADAEERARIAAENEALRKEAAAKEAALKAEREVAEKERKQAAEAARKESLRLQALAEVELQKQAEAHRLEMEKAKAERQVAAAKADSERAKIAEQARKDREARDKMAAEVLALAKKEQEVKEQEEHAAASAAKAPDHEKLLAIAAKLRNVTLPGLATKEGRAVLSEALAILEKKAGAM